MCFLSSWICHLSGIAGSRGKCLVSFRLSNEECVRASVIPPSRQHLALFLFLVIWGLQNSFLVVLICISLVTNDIGSLFMIFTHLLSLILWSVCFLLPFFEVGGFTLLLLICSSFPNGYVFSYLVFCLLIFLTVSFDEHLINGIKLSFTVSVFVTPRNFYLLTGCTNILLCYFLDIVLVFNFQVYDLSQVDIFWCGVVVKVYNFPKGICNCSVIICWKCFLFSIESSEVLCQNWLYVYGSISGLFCFTDLCILINTTILEFQCLYGTACCSSLERGHFLAVGIQVTHHLSSSQWYKYPQNVKHH